MKFLSEHRYGLITLAVLLMGSVVLVVGSALWKPPVSPQALEEAEQSSTPGELKGQQGPMHRFEESPWAYMNVTGSRTLSEYYSRRQYPGSPPMIPHPLQSDNDRTIGDGCTSCHADGGYVEELEAYAPVTPHPDFTSCKQCHLRARTADRYVSSNWKSVSPPDLGQSALPGSPPPMPHGLQMRETCMACHAGPATVEAIRTDHPDRGNCTQCHVPQRQRQTGGWKRTNDQ